MNCNTSFFLVRWLYVAMDWVYRQLKGLFSEGGWVVVLTILLFTLAIKLLTIFSDIKSRKSGIQMQAIQPDIERLKKKYANDPQKLSMEQRKLMRERGVSTLGGCLPMLIMMPLLFMFFAAFRAWSNQQVLEMVMKSEYNPALNQIALNQEAVEAFANSRFLWITNIWRPDNLNAGGTLMNGQEFWNTFAAGSNIQDFIFYNNNADALNRILYELHFFTRTLGEDGTFRYVLANDGGAAFLEAFKTFASPITSRADLIGGAYERMSNGYAILPILAGATTFLTSWLTQRSQKKALEQNGAAQTDSAQQTQSMNRIFMFLMPAMSIFFCYQYDSTFAFYWIFSNVISLAITLILNATVFKKMQQGTVEVIKK